MRVWEGEGVRYNVVVVVAAYILRVVFSSGFGDSMFEVSHSLIYCSGQNVDGNFLTPR